MTPRRDPCPAGARLLAWLGQNSITRRAFARTLGIDPVMLWRWTVGARVPHLRYAARIEDLTGIEIRAWVDVPPLPVPAGEVTP